MEGNALVNAELSHNPYLLQTHVTFNGLSPRINSQVEKYDNIALNDWIEKVPEMRAASMSGLLLYLVFSRSLCFCAGAIPPVPVFLNLMIA